MALNACSSISAPSPSLAPALTLPRGAEPWRGEMKCNERIMLVCLYLGGKQSTWLGLGSAWRLLGAIPGH